MYLFCFIQPSYTSIILNLHLGMYFRLILRLQSTCNNYMIQVTIWVVSRFFTNENIENWKKENHFYVIQVINTRSYMYCVICHSLSNSTVRWAIVRICITLKNYHRFVHVQVYSYTCIGTCLNSSMSMYMERAKFGHVHLLKHKTCK